VNMEVVLRIKHNELIKHRRVKYNKQSEVVVIIYERKLLELFP